MQRATREEEDEKRKAEEEKLVQASTPEDDVVYTDSKTFLKVYFSHTLENYFWTSRIYEGKWSYALGSIS